MGGNFIFPNFRWAYFIVVRITPLDYRENNLAQSDFRYLWIASISFLGRDNSLCSAQLLPRKM